MLRRSLIVQQTRVLNFEPSFDGRSFETPPHRCALRAAVFLATSVKKSASGRFYPKQTFIGVSCAAELAIKR
jgi:hypothetical protein